MHEGPSRAESRRRWLYALLVAAVALVPRGMRAWESREDILLRSTWDDSYYYFGIARNIIDGNGASFDGAHVTNGFHPLWLALITPFWTLGGDIPLHLALTLGGVFGAITAALVFMLLVSATENSAASATGGLLFALHPAIVADSVNGLESSVAVMMLALSLLVVQRVDGAARARAAMRADLVVGSALGLMMLARTDMAFFAAALLAIFAWRSGAHRMIRTATVAVVATAWLVPWLAWSYIATGSIVQISGRAGGLLVRQAFEAERGDGLWPRVTHGADLVREMLTGGLPHSYVVPPSLPGGLAYAASAAVVALVAWSSRRRGGRYAELAAMISAAAAALLVLLAYHQGVRMFMRNWYFTPVALLMVLALGLAVSGAQDAVDIAARRFTLARSWARASLYAAVAVGMLVVYQPLDTDGWRGAQQDHLVMYDAARWLRENTPAAERAGSFNAGIIGYYSDRPVINLDGVVNADAYEALKACAMTQYIREHRISRVADFRGALIVAGCGPPVVSFETEITFGPGDVFGPLDIQRVSTAGPP